MRRHAVLFLLLAAALVAPSAATATQPWDTIAGRPGPAQANIPPEIRARDYAAFALDRRALRDELMGTGPAVATIPAPDGSLQRFSVTESPVLAPRAQRRFPNIRTYAATGIDDPGATARLDLTPLGFHASVQTTDGMYYVDPRFKGDQSVYMSYYRSQLIDRRAPLVEPEGALREHAHGKSPAPRRAPGQAVTLRTYRLAIANDPTYAAYFDDPGIAGTDTEVQAAKTTLVNRMNQIYNDDLAIVMQLLDSSAVNLDTAAKFDSWFAIQGPGCDGPFITRNDEMLDAIYGATNYEVGHFVGGADFNGGGIAGLGVVGGDSKGRGCTGLNPPVGDGFAVDYVAHEIGHQYGGPHTFDGTGNDNCAGHRDKPTQFDPKSSAVEPGSGSSIQAYAGICGAENLQNNSDPYFSQESIEDILSYVTSSIAGANEEGFTTSPVANRSPVVSAPADRTIPTRTPFTLSGAATDPDGDTLVYMWEQDDSGGSAGHPLQSDAKTDGPLFRQFSQAAVEDPLLSPAPGHNVAGATDNVRSFPDPAQVAADNTNAETGACPAGNVECFSEWLPEAEYLGPMNFRLTARDRDATGGGLSVDDTVIFVATAAGPFLVTAPAGPSSLTGNDTATVTWAVAGTDLPPINTTDVRIGFSADGGLTFPYTVLASTPNDGSEVVTVPNVATSAGRFKVEAVDNYFYDVSDGNLSVALGAGATATTTPTPSPTPTPTPTTSPTPAATTSPTPTPSPSPTPTQTSSYTIPTVTPTVTPTTFPGIARLAPDLALVRRKLTPDGKGRIKLSLRCKQLTAGTPPATCTGRVRILDRRGRKLAARRFSFGSRQIGLVTLKVGRRTRAALRRRGVKGKLVAKVGNLRARKKVVLLPIR